MVSLMNVPHWLKPLIWWLEEHGEGSVVRGVIFALLGLALWVIVSYYFGYLFQTGSPR